MTKKLVPVLILLVLAGCTVSVAGEAMPDPAATATTSTPVTANDTVPPDATAALTTAPTDSPYVYSGETEASGGTGLTPNDGPNSFGGVK